MDFMFRKLSVVFLGVLLTGYGYYKNKERKKISKECAIVKAQIVDYEVDEDGLGRYVYEYMYNGRKYISGFDKLRLNRKDSTVEKKFGKIEELYCNKKTHKIVDRVYDYTSLLAILVGIIIILFGVFFV